MEYVCIIGSIECVTDLFRNKMYIFFWILCHHFMIRHMVEVQLIVPYISQSDVDCHVNMAYYTNMTVLGWFDVVSLTLF